MNHVSAENEINKRVAFSDSFTNMLLLHHTSAKGNDKVGVFLFNIFQSTHIAVNTVFRMLTDGAGVI